MRRRRRSCLQNGMRISTSKRLLHRALVLGALSCSLAAPVLAADAPPQMTALVDASPEAAWKSADKALRDSGYKVGQEKSPTFVSGRRIHWIRNWSQEDEAVKELRRISGFELRMSIDARRLSEYYVTLDVQVKPADGGKSTVVVHGKIMAVERARGRRGMPRPTAIPSRGVVEAELLEKIRTGVGMPPTPVQPPAPEQ